MKIARVAAVSLSLLFLGSAADAQDAMSGRFVAGEIPRQAGPPGAPPVAAPDPAFRITTLRARQVGEGYEAEVSFSNKSTQPPIDVGVRLLPPPGTTASQVSSSERTERASATLRFSGVGPDWGVRAEALAGTTQAVTRLVPLGSLTGEGARDEVRAWHQGARMIGDLLDDRSLCTPPAPAALDGFRAAVVQDKAVFTLHLRASPARVKTFEGAPVTGQRVLIKLRTGSDPTGFVGVVFDPASKTATTIDATVNPPQQIGNLKVDVLGQNVLVKTAWRFGDAHEPFRPDGTFGTLSRDVFVSAMSELVTSNTRCVIETASVRIDELAPRVRASATPRPTTTDGASPYFGLIIAFGGIGAIVALAVLSRRRAQRAGETSAGSTSDD